MKSVVLLSMTAALLGLAATASAQSAKPAASEPRNLQNPELSSLADARPSSVALSGVAPAVYEDYFEIQKALARDSLENVAINARALADLVSQDKTGTFRPELAAEAAALATAPDLMAARQIFKAVSGYLIQAYRAGKVSEGTIHEMHSPEVNVNWLQREDIVLNPYLGRSCLHCGTLVR